MPSTAQRVLHRQFAAVVRKEVLQTLRDRRILFMLLMATFLNGFVLVVEGRWKRRKSKYL